MAYTPLGLKLCYSLVDVIHLFGADPLLEITTCLRHVAHRTIVDLVKIILYQKHIILYLIFVVILVSWTACQTNYD